ncbi:hypothetical protein ASJ81_01685 [Methanosarcina spelaei]|uniref:Uncharacterized protein n=1 Tax=Methanosarcina spelaei TaxID=1036679 RepID=A0A2A2HN13_9EURY|nr:hypothetical protein [Methanosarcina spelaei]PAV10656.1 hypothetical protein ASJ81_01685 [Methanosarcina spelaei]
MLLKAMDPTQNVTLDIIPGSTGDTVTIDYVTPNSNQPGKFGNCVYLWQAGDTVPWGDEPQQHQAINGTSRQGSVVFNNLDMGKNDYIIGYAVGGETDNFIKYGNVCATAYLPQGSQKDTSKIQYFSTKIAPQVNRTSINVNFNVTPGVLPKTNGAWAALWRSKTNPYLNPIYDQVSAVPIDGDEGSVTFNDVTLVTGVTYTLAFMMSGWNEKTNKPTCQTAIAAVSTFKID